MRLMFNRTDVTVTLAGLIIHITLTKDLEISREVMMTVIGTVAGSAVRE